MGDQAFQDLLPLAIPEAEQEKLVQKSDDGSEVDQRVVQARQAVFEAMFWAHRHTAMLPTLLVGLSLLDMVQVPSGG